MAQRQTHAVTLLPQSNTGPEKETGAFVSCPVAVPDNALLQTLALARN